MTETQAAILVDMIEAATESNWPKVRDKLVDEHGWTPDAVLDACETLADIAHRPYFVERGDF